MAQARPLTRESTDSYEAWSALRAARARIMAEPFAQAGQTFQNTGFTAPPLECVDGDADSLPGEVAFEYGPNGDTRFYRVTVRVRWKGLTGTRVAQESFYLANVTGELATPAPLQTVTSPSTWMVPGLW